MRRAFLRHATELMARNDVELTLIDVGARNGIKELSHLAHFTRAYGFEPNPYDFEKLRLAMTDPAAPVAKVTPPYRSWEAFQYALADKRGRLPFHVARNPTASGLLEPNVERLREIVWKGQPFESNFSEAYFEGGKTIEVEVRTLDDWMEEKKLGRIDLLKIDVEGSEYEVLQGATQTLAKTGVIKTETCFIPFRKGQHLFSHVDILLRDHGFDLLRYEIERKQIGYKARRKPVDYLPFDPEFADLRGQPLSCDAIYVNRNITDVGAALAQAMVLLEKDYVDEALFILRKHPGLADEAFLNLLQNYSDDSVLQLLRTFRQDGGASGPRFRRLGYKLVDQAIAGLCKVRSLLPL